MVEESRKLKKKTFTIMSDYLTMKRTVANVKAPFFSIVKSYTMVFKYVFIPTLCLVK